MKLSEQKLQRAIYNVLSEAWYTPKSKLLKADNFKKKVQIGEFDAYDPTDAAHAATTTWSNINRVSAKIGGNKFYYLVPKFNSDLEISARQDVVNKNLKGVKAFKEMIFYGITSDTGASNTQGASFFMIPCNVDDPDILAKNGNRFPIFWVKFYGLSGYEVYWYEAHTPDGIDVMDFAVNEENIRICFEA